MSRARRLKPGRRVVAAIVLVLAGAIGACDRGGDQPEAADQTSADTSAPAGRDREAVFSEAEAAAILRAYGEGEIAKVAVAQDVSQSDAILSYTRVIEADYRAMTHLVDSTAAAIGQPARENALTAELRATTDSIVAGLRALPAGFNNTLMEEQVKAHRRALQLMDTALIPSARSPQLRNLFQALRPTMAAHLQRALQILADRRQAAAESGEPWVSGFTTAAAPAPPTVETPPPTPPAEGAPADTVPAPGTTSDE